MTELQQKIWNYLQENAVGKRNAVHIHTIASDLKLPNYGTNNDDVRASIADLVINEGKPIGTCRKGAFLITNQTEKEEAIQFLERSTRSTAIRNNDLYIPE